MHAAHGGDGQGCHLGRPDTAFGARPQPAERGLAVVRVGMWPPGVKTRCERLVEGGDDRIGLVTRARRGEGFVR